MLTRAAFFADWDVAMITFPPIITNTQLVCRLSIPIFTGRGVQQIGAVLSREPNLTHASVGDLAVAIVLITAVPAYGLRAEGVRSLQVRTHGTIAHVPLPAILALYLARVGADVPALAHLGPLGAGSHQLPVVAPSRDVRRIRDPRIFGLLGG